jgi:hypothetical protein
MSALRRVIGRRDLFHSFFVSAQRLLVGLVFDDDGLAPWIGPPLPKPSQSDFAVGGNVDLDLNDLDAFLGCDGAALDPLVAGRDTLAKCAIRLGKPFSDSENCGCRLRGFAARSWQSPS